MECPGGGGSTAALPPGGGGGGGNSGGNGGHQQQWGATQFYGGELQPQQNQQQQNQLHQQLMQQQQLMQLAAAAAASGNKTEKISFLKISIILNFRSSRSSTVDSSGESSADFKYDVTRNASWTSYDAIAKQFGGIFAFATTCAGSPSTRRS